MSNLGFNRLRLVNPYDVAFQDARSAVGATEVLEEAEVFTDLAEAVADCSLVVGTSAVGPRELQHPMRRLEHGAGLIREHLASCPAALLFGSEKYGLSNEDLSHCHWLMRIPTRRGHYSMNLGQSVAVCLYELMRNESLVGSTPVEAQPAVSAVLEHLGTQLYEILDRSGYVNPGADESVEQGIRRLVRRMKISGKDADLLLGMVRQIRWKLDQPADGGE